MKDPSARTRRFYVPSLHCGEVELPTDESHHAANVLRLKPGQSIELFDGKGNSATGQLTEVSRKHTFVQVDEISQKTPAVPAITLAFAIPKAKRLDWLLEKATELGVAALQPVVFQRSVAGGDEMGNAKKQRWMQHCVSAAKQCGLDFLPEISPTVGLDDFLANAGEATKIVGDCCDGCGLLRDYVAGGSQSVILLVGPEGGFTDGEREKIASAGFTPASLGDTILRIETAAVALTAAVRALTQITPGSF